MNVSGGMIVGFDADGPDIFERQYQFAMASCIPVLSLGSLKAMPGTLLYARLKQNSRLVFDEDFGTTDNFWYTNIIPKGMTRTELYDGMQGLANRLYAPDAFGERVLGFIECFEKRSPNEKRFVAKQITREIDMHISKVVKGLLRIGREEARMFSEIMAAASRKPNTRIHAMSLLFQYMQIRYLYEKYGIWNNS